MSVDALLLRFDAPMISFGGPAVDAYGVQQEWPGLAMVTGLFANALGWRHGDFERLQTLQDRLRIATRRDRQGTALRDYQTVDMGQPHLVRTGWTSRGAEQKRGGLSKTRTLQRYQDYKADAVYTLAITLEAASKDPTLDALDAALRRPARPLFLGRKCCLPASPLFLGRVAAAADLRQALIDAVRSSRSDSGRLLAAWPEGMGKDAASRPLRVGDGRDWANQVHCGEYRLWEGLIPEDGTR